MRAGIGSFAFGWAIQQDPAFDEQALVALAVRHGVRVVQLGDNLPAHQMPAARFDALVAACRARRVDLELGARGLTEAHLDTYLSLCRRAGARVLRFVADAPGCEPSSDDLVALLRSAAPEIASAGVVLGLENHDRFPAATLRHIVEEVDHAAVGICLDTANSLGAGEGLLYVTDLLAPFTVNLHVKDVTIRRVPYQMGFVVEGCALGRGQLPIRWTIERVREKGRCGTVILEGWTRPAASPDETVRHERAEVEAGIGVLERLLAGSVDPPGSSGS